MKNKVLKKVVGLLIIGLAANSVYASSANDSQDMERESQTIAVSTSNSNLDNSRVEAVVNPTESNVKKYLALENKTHHKGRSLLDSNKASSEVTSGMFTQGASYQVCFTPQNDCTALVVNTINQAKTSIDVQAYSFTSAPIIKALSEAEGRGVKVDILLDKSNVSSRYSSTTYLKNHDIPFLIDYKPTIAHNKVMIFDDNTVITGSFNFTKSAQIHNAENLIVIHDAKLAQYYLNNFKYRKQQSISLEDYQSLKSSKH